MTICHLRSQRPPVLPTGLLQVIISWASSHGCWLHQAPKESPAIKGFHLIKSDPYWIIPLLIITSNQIVWDFNYIRIPSTLGLPRWLSGKESPCQAGDPDSIPGLGRSPGEGNGNLLDPAFLPWKSQGQRSLPVYSPWGLHEFAKSQTRLNMPPVMQPYMFAVFC